MIRDVTVVSPERRTPLRDGYVVVEGDQIAGVGQGTPPLDMVREVVRELASATIEAAREFHLERRHV